ncbi:hypothetical protein D7Y24_11200 [Stenotrophomonas maltophilia]|nr:hypothetical protein [Stenotrophomonas maltophilia]MBA0352432.1 hypothetical protein [Stenotrophomonas maltophilia]QDY47614.1 hypothetical protein DUW70_03175 [Stenotrophomonas maltophilia]
MQEDTIERHIADVERADHQHQRGQAGQHAQFCIGDAPQGEEQPHDGEQQDAQAQEELVLVAHRDVTNRAADEPRQR